MKPIQLVCGSVGSKLNPVCCCPGLGVSLTSLASPPASLLVSHPDYLASEQQHHPMSSSICEEWFVWEVIWDWPTLSSEIGCARETWRAREEELGFPNSSILTEELGVLFFLKALKTHPSNKHQNENNVLLGWWVIFFFFL